MMLIENYWSIIFRVFSVFAFWEEICDTLGKPLWCQGGILHYINEIYCHLHIGRQKSIKQKVWYLIHTRGFHLCDFFSASLISLIIIIIICGVSETLLTVLFVFSLSHYSTLLQVVKPIWTRAASLGYIIQLYVS